MSVSMYCSETFQILVLSSADYHKSEVVNDESTSEWKGGGDRFLIGEGVARNIGHVTMSAMWAARHAGVAGCEVAGW